MTPCRTGELDQGGSGAPLNRSRDSGTAVVVCCDEVSEKGSTSCTSNPDDSEKATFVLPSESSRFSLCSVDMEEGRVITKWF